MSVQEDNIFQDNTCPRLRHALSPRTMHAAQSKRETAASGAPEREKEGREGRVYSALPAMRGNLKTGPCALGVSVLSELYLAALPRGSLRPLPCTHPWPG